MYMRQKKQETQIRKEIGRRGRGRDVSFGFNTIHHTRHPQEQIQSQYSPASQPQPPTVLTHQPPQFLFHYDQPIFSNHCSTTEKPMMSLLPSSSFSSLHSHHQSDFNFSAKSNVDNGNPFVSSVSIRTLAYKIFTHLSHARLLFVHLKVLFLISLPSLYLFLCNPHRFFILNLLSIIAFSITLLVSLNLARPRLPSIRLLFARSLPNNLNSTHLPANAPKPVIWSIGSNPKVENKLNSGSWVQVYSNGDVYEGEFHRGKCSGSGVYYYYMSGRYEGDWVDEKYDGYGVETWAKGSRYRGQYRQGLRHGIGVYRFYTGDVYAGEWSNGQCHGCGIHTCEDGSRYIGEFKWGVKHGLGRYHFRNGDTYAGEYFADKMHGFGVYQFGNGHRFEGAWHEGRRQGLGTYTFRNGEAQSGHWQSGILDVSSSENTPPGSPYAVSHSKVLNAVQEARRAAEKANDVARVEDRVNRTIAAANKAANAARVAAVKAVQKQMPYNNSDDDRNPFV
ncbi:uncharacterized protein LOC105636683 [Jatropha curcas]|nr:uncharacterized protein LOC105636683 [Jatropha curcas]